MHLCQCGISYNTLWGITLHSRRGTLIVLLSVVINSSSPILYFAIEVAGANDDIQIQIHVRSGMQHDMLCIGEILCFERQVFRG